jgi:hypothetical protein
MWAVSLVLLYAVGYAVARCSGQIVHYHYGQYANIAAGRPYDGTYHVIRSRSFGDHHPINGFIPTSSSADSFFAPLASLELSLRGLPAFERAW